MSFVTAGSRSGRKRQTKYKDTANFGGRLTLETGTPVETADQSAKTTIYYTPFIHDKVMLFDGKGFIAVQFSELSLALDSGATHTGYHQSGKNFDLFAAFYGGVPRLMSGPAWTSDTARASALARTNGVLMNSANMVAKFDASADTITIGANRGTYLGTFRATADGQASLTAAKKFLVNAYNLVPFVQTNSYSTTRTTTSATNTELNSEIRLEFLLIEDVDIFAMLSSVASVGVSANPTLAIAFDSTTAKSSIDFNGSETSSSLLRPIGGGEGKRGLSIGYHYCTVLGKTDAGTLSVSFADLQIPGTN